MAPQALAQGVVKSIHGEWQIRCDTPPGAKNEQCALIQHVTAEDRPDVRLVAIVLKPGDVDIKRRVGNDKLTCDVYKCPLMRVQAPLGVLLPTGLGLRIDSVDVGRAGYVRCIPSGCVAEIVMDDSLVKRMREGQVATYIIFQVPEEGIGIPLSLKGFGEGFDKLP